MGEGVKKFSEGTNFFNWFLKEFLSFKSSETLKNNFKKNFFFKIFFWPWKRPLQMKFTPPVPLSLYLVGASSFCIGWASCASSESRCLQMLHRIRRTRLQAFPGYPCIDFDDDHDASLFWKFSCRKRRHERSLDRWQLLLASASIGACRNWPFLLSGDHILACGMESLDWDCLGRFFYGAELTQSYQTPFHSTRNPLTSRCCGSTSPAHVWRTASPTRHHNRSPSTSSRQGIDGYWCVSWFARMIQFFYIHTEDTQNKSSLSVVR